MDEDSKLIFKKYTNSFTICESDEEFKSELIDIESVFGDNESEKYRKKRPGLYGRAEPNYDWKETYKENTDWGTWGFWVWNAIQILDITQITSLPDVTVAYDSYKNEANKANAAVLCFEVFFLVAGWVGLLGFDAFKTAFKIAKQSPKAAMDFFAKEVLPRKQLIFDTLNKIPKGATLVPVVQQAFSTLEKPEEI